MAERNITVQYKLRGDTLSNWSTKNPVLAEREPAIVIVPADSNSGLNEPAVLLKIGDGTTAFNDLGYVSAIAGDVPAWAKAATKPTYSADEITGLADYVNDTIQDTDTQYNIVAVEGNAYQYKLMSKAKGDAEYTTEVAVINIPKYDDTDLKTRVGSLEGLVGNTAVAAQITAAIEALKLADTYEAKGAAKAVQGETTSTVKSVEDALNTYKSSNDTAVAAAKKAGDDAQADVDALAGKVGTVAEGKTVVQMIEEAKTAATYDDTALAGRVTTLEGSDAGKSARAIAAEETAKIVAGADTSFDTLKEISDWISGHKTDAAAMNSAILALEAIVAGIGGEGEKPTVVAYVTDAIAALKIGDYAKAADLTALAGRVTTLEGDENTVGSVAKALKDAKAYTDEKDTAMDTRVDALEAVGATKVEASTTNGNVKINGVETPVYTLPASVLDAGDTFIFDGGKA